MKKKFITFLFFIFFVCNMIFCQTNSVKPIKLLIDPPTYHCLAFRWIIEGDDNCNATVSVNYKKTGEKYKLWYEALPLLRIDGDVVDRDYNPFKTGNMFAGSILNLEPGTRYDVFLVMSDPDGGYSEKIVEVKTNSYPRRYTGKQVIHLYPEKFIGKKDKPYYHNLMKAIKASNPGTVIYVHNGVYKGNYKFEKSGSPISPIIIRGEDSQNTIFDGENTDKKIFDIQDQNYLYFESIGVRNGNIAFKANHCKGLHICNCEIYDVNYAIIAYSYTKDWFINNNFIQGKVGSWYPRKYVKENYSTSTGITVDGSNIVVCNNTIKNFWDCLTINNLDEPDSWDHPRNICIDFYNNDISNAGDDGLEVDFSYNNVRIWNNRIVNAHVGISAQPVYGGPVYIFRNFVYNVSKSLKLHNWPSGLLIYNNTFISSGRGFWSDPIWQNSKIINNLFLGTYSYAISTGTPDERSIVDYNGYYKSPETKQFINWTNDCGKTKYRYENLYEFNKETGHEMHGINVKYNIFYDISPPVEGKTYETHLLDFRLKNGLKPIDAGKFIPTITDNYFKKAPDLGAIESNKKIPHFGIIPEGVNSLNNEEVN